MKCEEFIWFVLLDVKVKLSLLRIFCRAIALDVLTSKEIIEQP